jgi:uncharacterized iron-regulated membrane protein
MKVRGPLRRIHIWLGWIVGLPFLMWTVTGLVMVSRPIELVRGEGLIREAAPLAPAGLLVPPPVGPRAIQGLALEQRSGRPVWLVRFADGAARLADPATGRYLPPVTAAQASEIIRARYTGAARVVAVTRTASDDPPLELRREVAAWQVRMSDGTHFYLDAATGEILARRTPFWRLYDLMWGLHIMDLKTREDTSNPLVLGFAGIALLATIPALVLLPMTVRRRRKENRLEADR